MFVTPPPFQGTSPFRGGVSAGRPFRQAVNTINNGLKNRQKLHCGRNKFALRCGYRRTAVEKNLDCGAFFDELLQANEPKIFVIKFNVVSLRR